MKLFLLIAALLIVALILSGCYMQGYNRGYSDGTTKSDNYWRQYQAPDHEELERCKDKLQACEDTLTAKKEKKR